MTPSRSGSFIKRAKDITISSTLALAILASGVILPACSSSSESDDAAYSYEETTYSKGIRSIIREVEPGKFKITDEESVEMDQSAAIVTYLDGHTDTITPEAAKTLIDKEIKEAGDSTRVQNSNQNGYHRSGLSSMLLYGGMGYMLGRMGNNGYMNSYRNQNPAGAGFYSNPGTYQKAQAAQSNVQASRSTRTVTTRPSGGRSGFFGRSSARSGG